MGKLAILIISVSLILAITSLWNDSFIVDEIPHVGAGYSYVTKGDYRLNPEHPPLAKDLAGLAISLLAINQSVFSTPYWTSDINGQWNFGRTLIYNPANNVDVITRTAKTVMLLFFVLSALIIFRWTKEIYDSKKAGLLALFLFSFSPTVIAHSRFVTTDMPALFGVLLGAYFFTKYLREPSPEKFWLAVLAFGIAQLTKFSAVLLAPLFILMIITWAVANSFSIKNSVFLFIRSVTLMALGIILVVWPVYYLHTMNYPPEKQKTDTEYNLGSYGNRLIADPVVWASDKPAVRSLAQYATGVLMVNQRSIGGNTTFFMGEVRNYAWKKYFPIVYLIKEPSPFWLLTIMVLLFLAAKIKLPRPVDKRLAMSFIHSLKNWAKNWTKNNFVEFSMLLWIAMYWYLSIRANLNIGVRHLLPTYGFVFILLSGQINNILTNFKTKNENLKTTIKKLKPAFNFKFSFFLFTFSFLLGWYVFENFRVYPYYLTYFNQLARLRPVWATQGQASLIPSGGHLYAVDSNLDWGQDLKRLADWVEKNNVNKIYLDYFGWADQAYYLKDKLIWINAGKYKSTSEFLKDNPDGGHIAVSVSFYMGSRGDPENNYIWLDSYQPIAKIGNSIWIWHLTP